MTKAKTAQAKRVEWPKHGIKTVGIHKTSTGAADGFRYDIDPSEQQVRDNRSGPKLAAPRSRKHAEEQTSWLK